jgi:hypothetical protein
VIVRRRKGARPKVVFDGPFHRFTDKRLKNGRKYRYTVEAVDQAGNTARTSMRVVPTASRLLSPYRGAVLHSAPKLVWKKVRRAGYYNVQLFRGSIKMLTNWPRVPRLQLPRRLRPGLYRWYVWPGFGSRSAHRYGRALGSSSFRIAR